MFDADRTTSTIPTARTIASAIASPARALRRFIIALLAPQVDRWMAEPLRWEPARRRDWASVRGLMPTPAAISRVVQAEDRPVAAPAAAHGTGSADLQGFR